MNKIHLRLALLLCTTHFTVQPSLPPLGMFLPYDINIKMKKPGLRNAQINVLGEKSYKVQGYATDNKEDTTFLVNVLQVYEEKQNIVSMYQGYDINGNIVQTLTTPFTQLLDSIAGGPGGGVSNLNNGLYTPTANLSCGQFAVSGVYGLGQGFYLSAYLPFYFAKMSNTKWTYSGTNALFSDIAIQQELVDTFAQDALKYFGLHIGNWNTKGLGDLTVLAEWQRDFPQRRPTLRNVQANARIGIIVPTALKSCDNVVFPVYFGSNGAVGLPFGGGLSFNLGNVADLGFSAQFWYYWSNEQIRRVKTFATQTTLLFPIQTQTYVQHAIIQNFNLNGSVYSFCKRFQLKGLYQYWRQGRDVLIPFNSSIHADVINSAISLDEKTRHQFSLFGIFCPHNEDFKKIVPQFEIFWKVATNGMRDAIASSYGAQLSVTF
ncbi:hypothetical protein KBD08_01125 [Candidatus Babeliales bacterium]|nr:hypothetical protein [Candidatus Babeliales bacterium]